nr:RNA recognition motif domain containing protein [Haemonchus contortus]
MADDAGFDVDDMLENALESKSSETVSTDTKETPAAEKDKENGSSKRKKDKTRSKSRSRSRSRDRKKRKRSSSRDRKRSSSRDRRRRRSRSKSRDRAPLVIQRTCAERNRAANATIGTSLGFGPAPSKGPCKLHVQQLHPNITESMLDGIFDAFGRVEKIEIVKDPAGNSLGYGFVTFKLTEDGQKAMEQLNGFEIAGKPIKVSIVDEDEESIRQRSLDDVADEKQGLALGQGGRIQLMAKLAEGTGIELPQAAQQALQQQAVDPTIPAIATQCFMLSNMFDPRTETRPTWAIEVRDDVIEECYKNGGALHVYVDTASPQGNVYVKCPSVASAHKSVTALHGRWFSGKVITANYVPVSSYHELFPDAVIARNILTPKPQDATMAPATTAPVSSFNMAPPPMAGYGAPPPQPGFY